jgi:hypothetical protein
VRSASSSLLEPSKGSTLDVRARASSAAEPAKSCLVGRSRRRSGSAGRSTVVLAARQVGRDAAWPKLHSTRSYNPPVEVMRSFPGPPLRWLPPGALPSGSLSRRSERRSLPAPPERPPRRSPPASRLLPRGQEMWSSPSRLAEGRLRRGHKIRSSPPRPPLTSAVGLPRLASGSARTRSLWPPRGPGCAPRTTRGSRRRPSGNTTWRRINRPTSPIRVLTTGRLPGRSHDPPGRKSHT